MVAGRVDSLQDGVTRAAQAIDTGAARAVLERLAVVSNAYPTASP